MAITLPLFLSLNIRISFRGLYIYYIFNIYYICIAFKFFNSEKKEAICESAAHPSGFRGTQLTFGFVVSTHQQNNISFVVFNQYINPHT